jgi:hypothetical protein
VKIRVDGLGNDPRYALMKKTTQLLIDALTLWNASIAGSLSPNSFEGLKARHAHTPYVRGEFSAIQVADPADAPNPPSGTTTARSSARAH